MQENLSLYHIFYIVSRTGNISQAAKELYISQPAISRAIKKLEDNLDTILLSAAPEVSLSLRTDSFCMKK